MTAPNRRINAETVDFDQLWRDPYPTFARLRATNPVAFVPQADHYFITRFDDIAHIERHPAIFRASEPRSLVNRVMGHSFMRKDDEEHMVERKIVAPSFSPAAAKKVWSDTFREIAADLLDDLQDRGSADLVADFATPMAARSLCTVTGLTNIAWQDIARWSQALMDAVQNYARDPELARLGQEASDGIDAAIDAMIPVRRANPDRSILSMMLAGDMPLDSIRANLKVIIGGGQNEPRDANSGLIWALLSNPDQLSAVKADPSLWLRGFEEYVRWVSPIGMYPRTVGQETELAGVPLKPGDRLFLLVGSANRDEAQFRDPDRFDLHREESRHLAFGSGPHFCAGAWVARAQVADIAVPMLFERLKNLELDDSGEPARCGGWAFRGLLTLPARWSA
ncbi:cytochrome P450 [Polymorphum gilvum]|uniref:Cytochrome P450-pinF2, plant-inducible n=1 Tax=Polymorphum gilvum (strain LMG 25793 / CGMCC 1.9160 / SL003B-26A1) TaxID=991905 RepID=F2IXG3_POLGS|nr:cytochrome P450 [Polymorphum gilvum]ADZ71586.1 Cytochrome P450-pinF2, plant-inducible [Polymorphum gilvum SL003B-26A1]